MHDRDDGARVQNRRSKRDAHARHRQLFRIVTTDSFDSRSFRRAGDRIRASIQKKFYGHQCIEELDFASAGIARAMMPMSMRERPAGTNNTRELSLFYRYKSCVAVVIEMRSIASLHGLRVLLSLSARGVVQPAQRCAQVHVSLSGVAVSCILV